MVCQMAEEQRLRPKLDSEKQMAPLVLQNRNSELVKRGMNLDLANQVAALVLQSLMNCCGHPVLCCLRHIQKHQSPTGCRAVR
mmetsp:Transcript_48910/g.82099  ORF Transcript_48910/g.82099 Transcript_48910/m.82099 type:complete len:83 (-) Transcript_48910:265-513(-)